MKDAYYFSHDSNARNDQKILAVRMKYGIRGYGIYFGIVEMLRESKGYELLNDWSTVAFDLREPQEEIEDIVKNFELFVLTKSSFFSESLKRRMEELDERRVKRSIAGRVGGLASASKRQAIVDDSSTSKVKESKVNEIKTKHTDHQSEWFLEVWSLYPKRLGKKQALNHFKTSVITEVDLASIKTALSHYLASAAVSRGYVQNGATWFNNWRDWVEPPLETTPKVYGYTKDKKPVTDPEIAKVLGMV